MDVLFSIHIVILTYLPWLS